METRANFILIGAFTLLGIAGALGFFIWLASVQLDRQYARYGVLFDNVSGLDSAGDVFFNGVGVGKVTGIRIWENDPRLVYVAIEIDAETPISAATVAQMKSQGVTGVAYIELSGGGPNAAPLISLDEGPAIIPSQRSTVQALVDDAPDLITDAATVMAQLQALTGPENQANVAEILGNLADATDRLDAAMEDFARISAAAETATAEITSFVGRLDTIGTSVERTLGNADQTLNAANGLFDDASKSLAGIDTAVTGAQSAIVTAEDFIAADAARVAAGLENTLAEIEVLSGDIREVIGRGQGTFDRLDAAIASATGTFDKARDLMDVDLDPVLSDLQASLEQVTTAFTDTTARLPALADDLQQVIARADGVVQDVQRAVTGAAPGLTDFSTTGLSQLSQLAEETRGLVRSLQTVVRRIDRDPAGFLLDDRVPSYRR